MHFAAASRVLGAVHAHTYLVCSLAAVPVCVCVCVHMSILTY